MSQHDYIIDNQDGASFRADINSALAAIASNNSGSAEPSTKYAHMLWVDTTNSLIKQRNAANDGWITVATLGKTLLPTDSQQIAKAWVNFNGTGTVAIRSSYNVSSITDNAVGNYTVNFTTSMPNANYCVTGMCDITSGSASPRGVALNASGSGGVAPTTSAFKISTGEEGTNFADVAYVLVSVFST